MKAQKINKEKGIKMVNVNPVTLLTILKVTGLVSKACGETGTSYLLVKY